MPDFYDKVSKNFIGSMSWFLQIKPTNNVVVVWRLHYFNILIQELGSTKKYERPSTDEKSIVDNHCGHITAKFAVGSSENQEKLATLYWLPKLH